MPNFDKVNNAAIIGARLIERVSKGIEKIHGDTPEKSNDSVARIDTGIKPIGDFISTIKQVGVAKNNHFTFTFAPPYHSDLLGFGGTSLQMLNMMCYSCTLPDINIATTQYRTFGEAHERPNDKNYGHLQSTFYVDAHMHVKTVFDQWTKVIMDPNSRTFGYYNDYVRNVEITVYDKDGYPHYGNILEDAYPKTIGSITLAQDNTDIMKLDVIWAYKRIRQFHIDNPLNNHNPNIRNTQRREEIHRQLMGYLGDFKSYQDKFNNLLGDINRSSEMLKNKDWGGLVNQSSGILF